MHPRHPYGGDLVYTAFSGSHQDAIKKGFEALERDAAEAGVPSTSSAGRCPTCRSTRKDVGRTYEAVIRVNSQSGKGGVAYVLKNEHHLDLPRRMQIEFSRIVQGVADGEGGEISRRAHLGAVPGAPTSSPTTPLALLGASTASSESRLDRGGGRAPRRAPRADRHRQRADRGLRARAAELELDVRVLDYPEHATGAGEEAQAASYLEVAVDGRVLWGCGIHPSIVTSSLRAIVSAVNRA